MTRIILFLILLSLLLWPFGASGADIIMPDVRLENNEIFVTTGLSLDEKNLKDLKNGISKEITFYIDLFRVWKTWPDEFVTGKKIVKTLLSDPVKKEYIATSFDGATLIERRFKNFDSMLNWALNINDLKVIHTKELQPADYFVKITVESRLRKLPPIIGYLLFFVPEKEFRVIKDSSVVAVGAEK